MEKGLNLEKLISSKLCTDIIMLVKHIYKDVSKEKSTFQYLNQTRGNPLDILFISTHFMFIMLNDYLPPESPNVETWRSLRLRIYMQIGSWDDQKRLDGPQFSKLFDSTFRREKFATTLANHLLQSNFDGLLISWYYPGCVRVLKFNLPHIGLPQLLFL